MVPLGEERPMSRISVYVYASDPISQIGVASQLRARPEIAVVDQANIDAAQVAVVAAGGADDPVLRVLRAIQRGGIPRTVLVASVLDDASVVSAAEAGVSALVRRSEATPDRLAQVVVGVAAGEADMPADLLAGPLGPGGKLATAGT